MKLSVIIAGRRNATTITVPISVEDGLLQFDVPNVARSAACSFALDPADLRAAMDHLASVTAPAKPDKPPAHPDRHAEV